MGVERLRLGLAARVLALLIPTRPAPRSRGSPPPTRRTLASLAWAATRVATLGLAVLAVLPATDAAQLETVARILTDWGTVRCAGMRCMSGARGGLTLYWSAPILYVTKDHVPLLRRQCGMVSARSNVWDCRRDAVEQLPGSWGGVPLDSLWEWMPVLADAPDD